MKNNATISAIAEQIRGVSYKPVDVFERPSNGLVPLLRAGNIGDGRLLLDDLVYVSEKRVSEKQHLQNDDILICASSGSIKVVGKAVRVSVFRGTFGAFCKVLRPNTALVDASYFAHFFQCPRYRATISSRAAGANINNIRNEDLDSLEIPVPKISTQRAIAVRLDKVCDLIDKRQAQLSRLDELAKSLFVEMFGDPVDNPMRWETKPILSLGECRNGLNFAPNESGFSIPCIGVSDFKDRAIITREIPLQEVSLAGKPAESQLLRDGDFLFVRSNGNKALVGRCVLVLRDGGMTTFSGFCIRFRLHSHMPIAPRYLLHVFRSDSIRRKLAGRGANIQNMSQKTLEPLSIPVPPLSLQRTFVERIEAIDKSKFAIRKSLDELNRLYRSLLQQYFG